MRCIVALGVGLGTGLGVHDGIGVAIAVGGGVLGGIVIVIGYVLVIRSKVLLIKKDKEDVKGRSRVLDSERKKLHVLMLVGEVMTVIGALVGEGVGLGVGLSVRGGTEYQ